MTNLVNGKNHIVKAAEQVAKSVKALSKKPNNELPKGSEAMEIASEAKKLGYGR